MVEKSDSIKAPPIYAGIEQGRDSVRGKESIEHQWQEGCDELIPASERELDVDQHVTAVVERAYSSGKRKVNIVDIGSGDKGVFITSFGDAEQYPSLHAFLSSHAGMMVQVIGITAAVAGSEQGREIGKGKREFPNDSQISVSNNRYTITRSHTLGTFLQEKLDLVDTADNSVDVFFSTKAMGYFTPANFQQALIDIVENLAENGTARITDYDMVPAGYSRSPSFGNISLRTREAASDENNPFAMKWVRIYGEKTPSERKEMLMKLVRLASKGKMLDDLEVIRMTSGDRIFPVDENGKMLGGDKAAEQELDQISDSLQSAENTEQLIEAIGKLSAGAFNRFDWSWVFHDIVWAIESEDSPVAKRQSEKTRAAKRNALQQIKERDDITVDYGDWNALIRKVSPGK